MLNDVRITGDAGVEKSHARERNVIGIIPGEGSLAGEYVVIGAHYDHLGNAPTMMMLRKGPQRQSTTHSQRSRRQCFGYRRRD